MRGASPFSRLPELVEGTADGMLESADRAREGGGLDRQEERLSRRARLKAEREQVARRVKNLVHRFTPHPG
jgi:hypothetical protein